MRRHEVRVALPEGRFLPLERPVLASGAVERVAVHRLRRVDGDRSHAILEFSGDAGTVADCLDGSAATGAEVSTVDGRVVVDARVRLSDPARRLLEARETFDVFLEFPLRYVDRTDLLVTVLAGPDAFEAARAALDAELTLSLEKKRAYAPRETPFTAELTATQRRVFEAAVELDYYGATRGATYEEIGDAVGLSGATVGEHLRKIERKLVEYAL